MTNSENTNVNINGLEGEAKRIGELKCISINANSLVEIQRREDLLILIKKTNPDIVLISETKLNPKHKFYIENYTLIRNDRDNNRGCGGTAIAIKNKIKSGNTRAEFTNDLHLLFNNLQLYKPENKYILMADLNAKYPLWGDSSSNLRGTYLKKWLDDNYFIFRTKLIGPFEPSFPRGQSFLDICLIDQSIATKHLKNNKMITHPYDSDHMAVEITLDLSCQNEYEIFEQEEEKMYNFNKANWEKFREILQSDHITIPDIINLNNNEIEQYSDQLNEKIKEAIEQSVPTNKNLNSNKNYIKPKIEKLFKRKSYLLSAIHRLQKRKSRDKEELKMYQYLLHEIKIKIDEELKQSYNNFWNAKIRNIKINSIDMFPEINRIFRKKTISGINTLKTNPNENHLINEANIDINNLEKDENNKIIISNAVHILNLLGAYFASVNIQNTNLGNPRLNQLIQDGIEPFKNELQNDIASNKTIIKLQTRPGKLIRIFFFHPINY